MCFHSFISQARNIEIVADNAVTSTENVSAGNEEIRGVSTDATICCCAHLWHSICAEIGSFQQLKRRS